jgi:hypothetical protein
MKPVYVSALLLDSGEIISYGVTIGWLDKEKTKRSSEGYDVVQPM